MVEQSERRQSLKKNDLFVAPEMGSWVCVCFCNDGRWEGNKKGNTIRETLGQTCHQTAKLPIKTMKEWRDDNKQEDDNGAQTCEKKTAQEPIATRRRETRREAGRETKRETRRKTRRGNKKRNTWTEHFPKASTASDSRADTCRQALQAPSSELLAHEIRRFAAPLQIPPHVATYEKVRRAWLPSTKRQFRPAIDGDARAHFWVPCPWVATALQFVLGTTKVHKPWT